MAMANADVLPEAARLPVPYNFSKAFAFWSWRKWVNSPTWIPNPTVSGSSHIQSWAKVLIAKANEPPAKFIVKKKPASVSTAPAPEAIGFHELIECEPFVWLIVELFCLGCRIFVFIMAFINCGFSIIPDPLTIFSYHSFPQEPSALCIRTNITLQNLAVRS